jgi:hypothetical protein
MTESQQQSHSVKPGDQVNFTNGLFKAMRVRVVTACGTETVCDLHPGARLEMTVGKASANVYLESAEDYDGLKIVK